MSDSRDFDDLADLAGDACGGSNTGAYLGLEAGTLAAWVSSLGTSAGATTVGASLTTVAGLTAAAPFVAMMAGGALIGHLIGKALK